MPASHKLSLSVQYPDPRLKDLVPRTQLRRWVKAALFAPAELAIRFVDAEEGRMLNRDYRGKDYATNVLTFAYTEDEQEAVTQADIVLCSDVLQREAQEQDKTIEAHAAHLVVHGVLHAQGYDHEDAAEAEEMEALEAEILDTLGFANPYAGR
jgi:probable rRNA maturation factor